LVVRGRHSSILDVRSFRGADCDTDVMIAKVRKRLAVNKREAQTFDVNSFSIRKLNELEVRKQYRIKVSYRFAALENSSDSEDINRAWVNIQGNIKTSA
jgi:DNA-binding SARP family transcriptional activator